MKFWAIGDSYVDPNEYPGRGKKWASVMMRSLKSDKYFIFGNGGFDAETVLDNLLLNLHLLEDGDLVVLFLPTLWRHRLPLADNMIDKYSQLIDPPKTKNIEGSYSLCLSMYVSFHCSGQPLYIFTWLYDTVFLPIILAFIAKSFGVFSCIYKYNKSFARKKISNVLF